MGLEDYLGKMKDQSEAIFRGDRKDLSNYLEKHELESYFNDPNLPENRKKDMRNSLEKKLDSEMEKYESELHGALRKGASKSTMGLAVLNDLYGFVSKAPIANVTALGYSLFALKSLAEVPANIKYLKKSHDWYGELKHWAVKPLRYMAPVIGPALESGSFERMVRRGIIKRVKKSFIQTHGKYIPREEGITKRLNTPIGEALAA